ncbi:MAG: hypothetical protein GX319_06055 [Clostridiales bacterium]|nr:hypothetical protein [Bacillota bacterium]NLK03956.1 hypothetical protein [Clostridiales bacterium]
MSELIINERNVAVTTSQPVSDANNTEGIQNTVEVENMDIIVDDFMMEEEASSLSNDLGDGLSGTDIDDVMIDDLDIGEEGYIEDGIGYELDFDEGYIDPGYFDEGYYDEGYMDEGMEVSMPEVKNPLLSSWPFVIGISLAVLVVSIGLGALLAKLKIKKGIDLYED